MAGTSPLAFSYARFSSPEQAKGDSLRRQAELRDAWLAKSGATLDTSITLRDEGVSAFTGGHRQNPDRHALAAFLKLVQAGRVPRGSYLVVESLDRLSREHIRPALTLLLNLIESGIRVVQLLPAEQVFDDAVEPMALMMAIMELSRGHSESRMKSERVGRAWQEKKRNATGDMAPITKRCPAWLRVEGGKFTVDAAAAKVIRRVYRLAVEGHGIGAIAKRLNTENVPTIGHGDHWARSSVSKLLMNRAVVGEYQPFTRRGGIKRQPEGKPIANYFPPVVSEDDYHAARAAAVGRRLKGGRPSERVNVFTGLLRDARAGGSMCVKRGGKKSPAPTLVPYRATNGATGSKATSFPLGIFEEAILSRLKEIDPRDILPTEDGASANQVLALTGKIAELDARIEKVKAELLNGGELASLADVLRSMEAKRTAANEQLVEAQRAASTPLSVSWKDCKTLLDALRKAKDENDARTRLRAALNRIVEGIWCLFVAKGAVRIALVQMKFTGGRTREFMIVHKPKTGGAVGERAEDTAVRDFADKSLGKIDLATQADALRVEQVLETKKV